MTDIIRFEEFADEVCSAMALRYPDDEVNIKRVTKNNGVIYTGITVCGKDESVYPTMYLEPFYDELDGEPLTDEFIDRMCGIYESRRLGETPSLDFLMDYEKIRKNLRCKLINYKANSSWLEEVPHKRFLDLAIVPYYLIKDCDLGKMIMNEGSFVIRKNHVDMWKINADDLIDESIRNTLSMEKPQIQGIFEVMKKLNPSLMEDMPLDQTGCPMYVMTTQTQNGAVSMLYEDKIGEFCNKIESDVFIIPSSINEIILVPGDPDMPETAINEMIREVNETQLRPVEVLSDHVYYFSRNEGYRMAG